MDISIPGILLASVLQFIIGAVWYMPLFGKVWGQIHGFDKISAEEQAKMQKGMWPLLAIQFGVTLLLTFVFAFLLTGFASDLSIYLLAFLFWLGFIVPTQVSAVLFGGTDPKWVVTKIAIAVGGSLACILGAALVLSFFR